MAVKWSTPGIGFHEIDNTIRPNAEPGDGIGAIVINANRGLPNQRVLCTTIDKFHEFFGTPDNPNQYGHFAAQVYFDQGGATQLLVVRATQGDEGYSQIQFPYTDSVDKNTIGGTKTIPDPEDESKTITTMTGIQKLSFVDNELINNLRLIQVITTDDYDPDKAVDDGFEAYEKAGDDSAFAYHGKSKSVMIDDIYRIFNGNPVQEIYVYRDRSAGTLESVAGKAGKVWTSDDDSGIYLDPALFSVSTTDYSREISKKTTSSKTTDFYWFQNLNSTTITKTEGEGDEAETTTYYETVVHIPASVSLNNDSIDLVLYSQEISEDTTTLESLISDTASNVSDLATTPTEGVFDVYQVNLVDWDDGLTKTFVITKSDWDTGRSDVKGLQFTEYGTADSKYVLTKGTVKTTLCSKCTTDEQKALLRSVASEYGLEVADISNGNYAIIQYYLAKEDGTDEIQVLAVVDTDLYKSGVHAANEYEYTWAMYLEYGAKKPVIKSHYGAENPTSIVKPWQVAFDGENEVNKLIAISSTEVFSDPSGIWKDGYTPGCETDAEPGNGDIEQYQSNKTNQLVIGAIGPGEFGNDIGVSIITPAAAQIPALYGQNGFSWLYRYDDEDKVDDASLDYKSNEENLTWKKVYKINVYVKAPSKTQSVWGFGLDALMQSPVESFLVSNDPNAKDENGDSLWAPYVINGNSQFIYVSKKSVEQSVNYKGEYCMPEQTFSIYQLTGGTNSELNNVKEKTKALDLYKNRKKAYFDYLFNVEPIETFSGKQKYKAMQDRIAQLAISRKLDLGLIQATSKEAKTIRLKLSEAKTFAYSDGSYVAAYDDYDRYFDPFTSTYVMLPRSVAAAVACCYVDNFDKPWMAPAGVTNGKIAYSDRPMTRLDDDEYGQLYDININSTLNYPGYGDVIMGQKTMLKKESAFNRVDVRKLSNYIEKHLETKLIPFLYQKNTTTNRSAMKTAVDAFLGRIMSGQGILEKDVKVIPDPSDTHLVYVNISFVPAESIERIEVTLILNRQAQTISYAESTSRI
jgi:hypothetical protein